MESDSEHVDGGCIDEKADWEGRKCGIVVTEGGKVAKYQSDYIHSFDPRCYDDTSEGLDADDAKRHKSNKKYYDPKVPLEDFCLDLRFVDLK